MTGAQLPGGQQLPGQNRFRAKACAQMRRRETVSLPTASRDGTPARSRPCNSAGRSASVRRRRRGRDGRRSGGNAPRSAACRRCGPRFCPPRFPAADRSSASRCRFRTWCRKRTAAGRSRRRRRCPCGARSGAGSSPAARCPPCGGFHIAAGSAARAIPHRSSRSRTSRRPWPADTLSQRKAARPKRPAMEASRMRRSNIGNSPCEAE